MNLKNNKKEYNLTSILNGLSIMDEESMKKERRDLVFKMIIAILFIETTGNFIRKLILDIGNNYMVYGINFALIPFLSFLALSGLYVGLIGYFVDAEYFNISSLSVLLLHKRRIFMISQLFIVYVLSLIISAISFGPILYLLKGQIGPETDIFFMSLYLVDNYVIQTILFAFIGMTIIGIFDNAFIVYFFNTAYNSMLFSDKYSGFVWNFKESVKGFFNDNDSLIKSIITNVFFSSFRIFIVLMVVVISKFFTEGKDALDFIIIINISKYIMVFLLVVLDAFKMIALSRIASENIKREGK